MSAAIHFASPDEAWARLRAASFWSTVAPTELAIRYGRDVTSREEAWRKIRHGFRAFTERERAYLQTVARKAVEMWERLMGEPFPKKQGPIVLACWPAEWDWGYPYTVCDMIVLPETMTFRLSPVTFLHEALHIWQRRHGDLFRRAYEKEWGFRYIPTGLRVGPEVRRDWVSNPDGWDNHYWAWHHPETGAPWCLVCVLDPIDRTPCANAIAVDWERQALDPTRGRIDETELRVHLGDLGQLYHPHELLAKHLERWLRGEAPIPPSWHGVLAQLSDS